MKRAIVEIAARMRSARGRCASAVLLSGSAALLSGCAGSGIPHVADAPSGAAAAVDSALVIPSGPLPAPTPSSPAAEVTRWSAAAWAAGRHDESVELLSAWLSARGGASSPTGMAAADEAAVRAALAVHLEALGRVDEASAVLVPCAAGDAAVARARTWLNLRGDGFASALADAERAVAHSPASAADRNNLGIALLYAGRPREAREAFLAARELDPALPGALYNLAIVESAYFFDEAAARRWLDAYRRLSDEDPDGLFVTVGATDVATREGAGTEALP